MPKLAQVTPEEFSDAMSALEDVTGTIRDLRDRIEKGYSSLEGAQDEAITTLTLASINAMDLMHILNMKARMLRDREDLEQLMKARIKQQSA